MSDNIYSQFFDQSTTQDILFCHHRECGKPLPKGSKKYCNLTCCNRENASKQKSNAALRLQKKIEIYEQNPSKCIQCNAVLPYMKAVKDKAKYCSHSCAAKYTNGSRSEESRQKQIASLKKSILIRQEQILGNPKYPYTKINWKICPITGIPFHTRSANNGRRQQSPYSKSIKQIYYQLCAFKFNVYKMPDIFDLSLLDRFGWYTCPGKKRMRHLKNTAGISRDHLYSVSMGLAHKIHPLLLSHPVNCQLVQHRENKLKHNTCSITIDQLISRIQNFDNKDNRFHNHCLILDIINNNQTIIDDWESLRKFL